MLRISVALLLMTFALLIAVSAVRTGRVQVAFSPANTRARDKDPLAFWFFTVAWSLLATFAVVVCSLFLLSALFGVGPVIPPDFLEVTIKQWPLAVIGLLLLYLIVEKLRDLFPGHLKG